MREINSTSRKNLPRSECLCARVCVLEALFTPTLSIISIVCDTFLDSTSSGGSVDLRVRCRKKCSKQISTNFYISRKNKLPCIHMRATFTVKMKPSSGYVTSKYLGGFSQNWQGQTLKIKFCLYGKCMKLIPLRKICDIPLRIINAVAHGYFVSRRNVNIQDKWRSGSW